MSNQSHVLDLFQTIHSHLMRIEGMLQQILNKETQMAVDVSAITNQVDRQTTVNASIVQLLNNVVATLNAMPPSSDPVTQAALDALTTTITSNNDAIAAAVVANTPAAPVSGGRR